MPEPLTLIRSKSLVGEAPLAGHREHLAGEGLVELDQVDVGELQPACGQRLRRRRHRADAHRPRRHPGDAPGDEPGQRAQAQLGGLLRGGDDRDGGAVVLAAGVAGGDGRLGVVPAHDRAELGEGLDGRVGADVLVAVDDGVALPALHGDRARSRRRTGPPRRRRRPAGGCGRRTRPAPRGRSCTRARRFSAVSIMPPGTGWFRPPAVTRPRASPSCSSTPGPGLDAPAHGGRVERRVAHRLRATGEHEVGGARLHLHRRVEHGLQARAAAPVDLQPGGGRPGGRRRARRPGRSRARPSSGSSGRAGRPRPTPAGRPVRSMSARITVAASSCAGTSRSDPPKPPTGVRSGSQMTASRTVVLPVRRRPSSARVCPRGGSTARAALAGRAREEGSGDDLGRTCVDAEPSARRAAGPTAR